MRRRQPTIKTLLLLTAVIAAYAAVFVVAIHGARPTLYFLSWRGGVLTVWVCYGMSVILTARGRWRAFTDCFGLRLAACAVSYLIMAGPPWLPEWYPPGTYIPSVRPRVPTWAADLTFEATRFDLALNDVLNCLVDNTAPVTPPVPFGWSYAMGSFVVTSALYGLFMYAVARTCKERGSPSASADTG